MKRLVIEMKVVLGECDDLDDEGYPPDPCDHTLAFSQPTVFSLSLFFFSFPLPTKHVHG